MLDSIAAAANWITEVLTGPIAIALGTLALASIGFAALTGRLNVAHTMRIVLGLFVLFGASQIAAELRSASIAKYSNEAFQSAAIPNQTGTAQKPNTICWTC